MPVFSWTSQVTTRRGQDVACGLEACITEISLPYRNHRHQFHEPVSVSEYCLHFTILTRSMASTAPQNLAK